MTNDQLDKAFSDAVASGYVNDRATISEVISSLASQVSVWRGQANYWFAMAAERGETIEALKQQIKWLQSYIEERL
jgi:peptidoglycan hydrolase CwlO-like protein